ncbi:MAG: hypothetical protein ACE5I3_12245 [Phycisphaerae bacterium]
MERCKKAIHLRTGDRGTDGAISTWLARHGVEVVNCTDPFEACAVALTQRNLAPDLALIGADWLAPDERSIIGYLREIWPGLTTVVYGSPPATSGFEAPPPTLVCRSAGAVRRMLANPPDTLLKQSLEALRSHAPGAEGSRLHPEAPSPDAQRVGPREATPPPPTIQTHDAEMLAAELAPRVGHQEPGGSGGKDAPASHDILTREELAALLEDDED